MSIFELFFYVYISLCSIVLFITIFFLFSFIFKLIREFFRN